MTDVDQQHPERCPTCGREDRVTAEDIPWMHFRRYICHACWASWDIAHFVLVNA